jgi:hypothetical protein
VKIVGGCDSGFPLRRHAREPRSARWGLRARRGPAAGFRNGTSHQNLVFLVLAVAVLAAVLTLVGWLTLAWMGHREYV